MWWFLAALIIGAGIMALVLWLREKHIKVTWYEWLMGALALLLAVLSVQHFVGSLAEWEVKAAWMGILVFDIPALILAILAVRLPWHRYSRK